MTWRQHRPARESHQRSSSAAGRPRLRWNPWARSQPSSSMPIERRRVLDALCDSSQLEVAGELDRRRTITALRGSAIPSPSTNDLSILISLTGMSVR